MNQFSILSLTNYYVAQKIAIFLSPASEYSELTIFYLLNKKRPLLEEKPFEHE